MSSSTQQQQDASSSAPWSIAVKTVGAVHSGKHQEDFVVTVSPDDDLTCLHHEIESITGLEPSQQRLIYRGRLISTGGTYEPQEQQDDDDDDDEQEELAAAAASKQKIRDVAGLGDGQTIHLVPKPPANAEATSLRGSSAAAVAAAVEEDDRGGGGRASNSGSTGASLLGALLGLSLDDDDDDDDGGGDASNDDTTAARIQRLRNARRSRRNRHRRTASDLAVPDPGSLEPVRQGLLTLHTMLEPTRQEQPHESPLDANRLFYRGQWVDCRDTVNQWLEATVVDIVRPEDVLPERMCPRRRRRSGARRQPATDPPVGASDFEGRRRLLLEPQEDGGVRERENNDDVQLLLVHYNGWASRWDEWLRSDSERIRPFRTRTRHSGRNLLPSPESVLQDAPSTSIRRDGNDDDDDGVDRMALLPELNRVVSAVNELLIQTTTPSLEAAGASGGNDLPWLSNRNDHDDDDDDEASESPGEGRPRYSRRQLEMLAPLLDRLGRTLTGAAPHVASLAASLPEEKPSLIETECEDNNSSVHLHEESRQVEEPAFSTSTGSGFFSLLSRESRRRASTREPSVPTVQEAIPEEEPATTIDPDYVDFVNGMINTSGGGSRSGSSESGDDGASSLLGAYLAAASLGSLVGDGTDADDGDGGDPPRGLSGLTRLVRQGGNNNNNNNGGGIDIHIHAIVTGPGVGPGALGLAMLGQPPTPTAAAAVRSSPSRSSARRQNRRGHAAALASQEQDDGIFAELYSENPTPLDPHADTAAEEDDEGTDGTGREDGLFEDSSGDHEDSTATSRLMTPPRSLTVREEAFVTNRNTTPQGQSRQNFLGRLLRRTPSRRRPSSSRHSSSDGSMSSS